MTWKDKKLIKDHYQNKEVNENWFNSMFISEPLEKKWWMTYCSRTARKNLYNMWVPYHNVPRGSSAIASMNMYWEEENYSDDLLNIPNVTNVLDLYIDTRSKYEHRAAAFLNNWEWYVLDPYLKSTNNTRNPIPLNKYIASNKIIWAFAFTV